MKSDLSPSSTSRRLLASCGFAVCWLGAAVTGMQATAPDRPVEVPRVEQRTAGPGQVRPEPATQTAEARRKDAALETVAREPRW